MTLMKKLMFLSLLLVAAPLFAQNRVDLLVDVEGVRQSNQKRVLLTSGIVPTFDDGGGVGVGLNWFLSDRVSLETKVAGLGSRIQFAVISGDVVSTADLGYAQIYPISAMLQWHFLERGAIRPYIGAGAVYTILRNIEKEIPSSSATGVEFKDPVGLLVGGGLEWSLSKQWSLYGDARYVPLETETRATFINTNSVAEFKQRPLIVSFGVAYRIRR